ncbi:GerMN domain-containing protein [Desulforamulus hydrothermalis]|uniref:Lipoprotein LpqB, GerMN domain protein n=1 Tax=Desulforamulus hydrothermalis Lam5 = DSM 18033 TaxID=1121428 RepID=K8EH91_9FIRM|nr:GerMN domain-containing protein [Desulforamulus hydrothermalis]CCO08001.1 Lipoprotein LpqB, GerMN domain protein [Desulforamulus hydrothermalis Lam5 = DSM 18033]SHG84427.1 Sporulation and spore germination [Desulforamulus hydrothermalis Lam5 = DSM 18033]
MKKAVLFLIMVLALALSGCTGNTAPTPPKQPAATEVPAATPEKVKVTLYFANEKADALVPVVREIDQPNDMVVALVEELKKPGRYAPVLPEGSELIYYKSEGDTLVLNFNRAFGNLQGSTGEFIAVNSLVNTLTELPQYKQVKLLVERQPLATGHAIYDKPIPRNESVIQK